MANVNNKTLNLVYIGAAAAIIAVCAWITVPIGAIPITLQTMAVCLVAALLGWKKGTPAVLIYILLGAIGVPVFSGFRGGIGVLLGATGGYIIGFIFTALLVGIASDKSDKLWVLMLSMVLGVAVCYAFGTAWFMLVYAKNTQPIGLSKTLGLCVTPFLLPDAVKIVIAALLARRLKPLIRR